MIGPRACAWCSDREYERLALAAIANGAPPPPRHLPPHAIANVVLDSLHVPPRPRRRVPPPPTPVIPEASDFSVACAYVSVVWVRSTIRGLEWDRRLERGLLLSFFDIF